MAALYLKSHRRKYTKMNPFFQGEVESTEKKWVFFIDNNF